MTIALKFDSASSLKRQPITKDMNTPENIRNNLTTHESFNTFIKKPLFFK